MCKMKYIEEHWKCSVQYLSLCTKQCYEGATNKSIQVAVQKIIRDHAFAIVFSNLSSEGSCFLFTLTELHLT